MKKTIFVNWEAVKQRVQAKKAGLLFFFAGIVLLIVLFFWNGSTIPEVSESASGATQGNQQEAVTKAPDQTERGSTKTTYWFWEGSESGVPSREYLTLCGDGTYILTIELEGHNQEEMTGAYQQSGETLQLWRDHKKISGTITKDRVTIDRKTYEKTECGHV